MSAIILDGKKIANEIKASLKKQLEEQKNTHPTPGLAVVLIGADNASEIYVRNKIKSCQELGINSFLHQHDDLPEQELLTLIEQLNQDKEVSGILIQLPLPKTINTQKVLEAINPNKDVDGFHPYNFGRLLQKQPGLRPCTPKGIMTLLESTQQDLTGLHAVVVGASTIVGRPMAAELLMANCTVSICHSKTNNLEAMVKQADILVSAVGKPGLIKGEWIKDQAIVIDVGITRLASGKLCGDVEFNKAKEKASWITPVPGGVGPMTVASLMQNTIASASLKLRRTDSA